MARALQILNDKEMAIFENAPPGWDDLDGNWSNSGDVRGLCSQGQWTNPGPNAKRHGPESACRLGRVRYFLDPCIVTLGNGPEHIYLSVVKTRGLPVISVLPCPLTA